MVIQVEHLECGEGPDGHGQVDGATRHVLHLTDILADIVQVHLQSKTDICTIF